MMSIVTTTKTGEHLPLVGAFHGRLIVSCQAPDGDPFRSPESMARFAKAAVAAGAAGVRANGPQDVQAVRNVVDVPIIALQKRMQADGQLLITPSIEDAAELVKCGANMIAVDCTIRGQKTGALDRIRHIRSELGVPVVADIATLEEAIDAAAAGADVVASTMRGYSAETASVQAFEPEFIAALVAKIDVPVVAEGRIHSPAEAALAIRAGAHAVVVGTAITRPYAIAARFAQAVRQAIEAPRSSGAMLGIDIGGSYIKCGIVTAGGTLHLETTAETPRGAGRGVLMKDVQNLAAEKLREAFANGLKIDAVGVATAGWVDRAAGTVKWATSNLHDWTGATIADELHATTGLRVVVENDAVAAAAAERHFGAARAIDNFVCLTLGTGVGGGCYVEGRLLRGAHSLGNALGHICIEPGGRECSCGRKGCLEMYANAESLVRYAGASFGCAEEVIEAARRGSPAAVEAIRIFGSHLAAGLDCVLHVLDPELVLISGGLAQNNDLLFRFLNQELATRLMAADQRRLSIRPSTFGYYAGVLGAVAVAHECINGASGECMFRKPS